MIECMKYLAVEYQVEKVILIGYSMGGIVVDEVTEHKGKCKMNDF